MTTKIITGVIISLVLVTTTLLSLSILHRPTELLEKEEQQDMGERIKLPEPCNTSNTSVEMALSQRRSIRAELADAARGQECVRDAAIDIVFTAVYERTTRKYGERGIRCVHTEVGHAAQNVYLQAVSLDLGTVVIGAFNDRKVAEIANLSERENPLYIFLCRLEERDK